MKCTNNILLKRLPVYISLIGSIFLTGCGVNNYDMPYSSDYPVSSYRMDVLGSNTASAVPFASDLCVVGQDVTENTDVDMSKASAAGLFSLDTNETFYAKNVHEKLAPASLTKVMTALVALKYGSPDQVLTASANVKIKESGAQLCGLKEGDKMTLDQALHIMLINSANDAAILIAEGIGGSVEGFAEMMNKEAKAIGATNSNFVNPNGLNADNHYVTAYDMYLIFNEACRSYDLFKQIILMPEYSTTYTDKDGKSKEISVKSTNLYVRGDEASPNSITVIGGKTGTTSVAGHCLILLSKDSNGKSYISVILRSEAAEILYSEMTDLLTEIKN